MAFATDTNGATSEMVDLLSSCLGYQVLRGRRDFLSVPLRPHDLRRLDECERTLQRAFGMNVASASLGAGITVSDGGNPVLQLPGRELLRRSVTLPVEVWDSDGRGSDGLIRDLSPSGMFVATQRLRRRGERCRFRFVDPTLRFEWLFCGEVAWSNYGAEGEGPNVAGPDGAVRVERGMGFRFIGIPLELRIGHRPTDTSPLFQAA